MTIVACPHCRARFTLGYMDPLDERADTFMAMCAARRWPVSADGRVPEAVAARLLGVSQKTLQRRRHAGDGPALYSLPVGGSRFSFSLRELAAFVSAHERGEPWA